MGAIIASVAALLFTNFWYAPYQVIKKLDIKFHEYYHSIISKIFLPILFNFVSIFYINNVTNEFYNVYVIITLFFLVSIISIISLDQKFIINYIKKYYLKLL